MSVVIAYFYFTKTAGSLPHFFPGYTQGSAHKHTKHGLAFIGLAVVFIIGAWMVSGDKGVSSSSTEKKDSESDSV